MSLAEFDQTRTTTRPIMSLYYCVHPVRQRNRVTSIHSEETMKTLYSIVLATAATMGYAQETLPPTTNGTTTATANPREELCQSNIMTCSGACGGEKPTVNTCDSTSLKWDCSCPGGNQTIADYAFPIPINQCQDGFTKCVDACIKKDRNTLGDCGAKCNTDFSCGTKEAPPVTTKGSSNTNSSSSRKDSSAETGGAGSLAASAITAFISAGLLSLI